MQCDRHGFHFGTRARWHQRRLDRIAGMLMIGVLATLAGCGRGAESTVSGRVTLDGTALDGGYVTFSSAQAGGGNNASGQIQSGGTYEVQAGKTGGLPAGQYKVAVSAREKSKPSPNGGPPAPGKLLTPAKYANADSSDLLVDVKPGRNVIDLPLSSE